MEHLVNNQKGHPNLQRNSHKLCDETGHIILSMMESQSEFSIVGKPLQSKCQHQKKEVNLK